MHGGNRETHEHGTADFSAAEFPGAPAKSKGEQQRDDGNSYGYDDGGSHDPRIVVTRGTKPHGGHADKVHGRYTGTHQETRGGDREHAQCVSTDQPERKSRRKDR